MTKLTEFGKAIRKIRIDYDTNLNQLANSIGVSSAFLSAVETGKKPVSAELIEKIINVLGLSKDEESLLTYAASQSVENVTVRTGNPEEAELALLFARRIQNDSLDLAKLKKILEED
ncbi:MAG: helix-turn-helix domain-containing protein [Acinetobacter populi]|jgi:transcriptional regulator with XRE-family HTH domain|uniref:helix-turn-helix domain-containing protein n=1 Tax=Acinetobacter populi TaxID=1582270 RepID=UPI002357608A|nr:helix-turn-helix transcriptional regulator [Acinetobacter populi]MCH4247575.1 helix-turn-helix domain-containing protein [Acinetobacter populi]